MKPLSNGPSRYLPDPGLESVVDLALDLEMPLLVTGEPGTGKTRLANYVLHEKLGRESEKPLIFNTKTTSQSHDLFYSYDALRHFRDSGRARSGENGEGLRPVMDYITLNALGEAIANSAKNRQVVLIDEIDKAPRDFSNDILYEFEHQTFRVAEATPEETRQWADKHYPNAHVDEQGFIHAKQRPVLILTSNSEKNLPDAFLRRVLYHHITFPGPQRLKEIIEANVVFEEGFDQKMVQAAIDHFEDIRKNKKLRKNPATAELLSWIHVLHNDRVNLEEGLKASGDKALKNLILKSYSLLAKNQEDRSRLKKDLGL